MEARQDPAVACRIQQREREALIAARLLERVVADETDPLERPALCGLECGGPRRQRSQVARDTIDSVELTFACVGDPRRPGARTAKSSVDPARPTDEPEDRDEQQRDDDDEADDERPEIGLDEGVEIDPRVLRWGGPSLAGHPYRGRIRRDAILCRRQTPGAPQRRPHPSFPLETSPNMAKRVRGSTSRPGQRPPLQRTAARPATRPAATTAPVSPPEPLPDDLTDEEEARAAVLEAAIVAEEQQAETTKDRARATRPTESPRPVSSLSISAADEYQYVARDVRRIAIVGGSLVLILLGMWVLSHILGMGPL